MSKKPKIYDLLENSEFSVCIIISMKRYFLSLLFFLPLSVWVEESVGTLDLFLTLEGIISIFHHKIYLLVFVKKSFIRLRNFPSIPNMLSFYPFISFSAS